MSSAFGEEIERVDGLSSLARGRNESEVVVMLRRRASWECWGAELIGIVVLLVERVYGFASCV